MKLLRSKTISSLLSHIHDEAALYLLVESNGLHLVVFDLKSFELVANYPVYVSINHAIKWCVDSNCIYLPTLEGQILAIDKFSGSRLVSMDLGTMMVIGNLAQDDHYIYSLCGLPISNGVTISLQIHALCANDKESGKKTRQSQCLEGKTCSFLLNEHIWSAFDKHIVVFDNEFDNLAEHSLSFVPWSPVATKSFICFSSASGALEIFDKVNFQCVMRTIVSTRINFPIDVGDDCLCCMAKEGVYKIDLQKQTHELLSNKTIDVSHGSISHDGVIFASDRQGICTKYRIGGGTDVIDLQEPCSQPILFEDKIILVSVHNVYEIGA